jgi:putative redox protein
MTVFSAELTLREAATFDATSGSGHTVVLDSPEITGGGNHGACPLELLLMGVGGCAGMVVASILRRMRQDVTAYRVSVRGDRVETHPKVFSEITVEHVVEGNQLDAATVRRALTIASTQLCPVVVMVGKGTRVTHIYRLIDAATRSAETGRID